MILFIKKTKTKDFIRKLIDLKNEFSNVAGYKINAKKSMAFLYTNSELTEKETKKEIPFTIAPKKLRYLGINLTKEVKDLYTENYTALKERDRGRCKQMEEHTMFMDW